METLKVMATIDDALYEVEVKQIDPKQLEYEVCQDGKQIGVLYKANDNWYAKDETCLMPNDIETIGKAVDKQLEV
ncbi:hypothetical protein [Rubrolithibacter danxiaensis]|uniref:hypothetical protein n=1 Tax=Rubrolithibacter danxiaensis TaxID=3390805 RepID=UPI003BF77CA9